MLKLPFQDYCRCHQAIFARLIQTLTTFCASSVSKAFSPSQLDRGSAELQIGTRRVLAIWTLTRSTQSRLAAFGEDRKVLVSLEAYMQRRSFCGEQV